MELKKRNKVSAEFSMSSLTDIIFLLLIFFMLTATFIQIQNVELPQSDSKTVASTSIAVTYEKSGAISLNGLEINPSRLEQEVRRAYAESENKEGATLTIVAEVGVPFERLRPAITIASKMGINAIIATQARK